MGKNQTRDIITKTIPRLSSLAESKRGGAEGKIFGRDFGNFAFRSKLILKNDWSKKARTCEEVFGKR